MYNQLGTIGCGFLIASMDTLSFGAFLGFLMGVIMILCLASKAIKRQRENKKK